jgi:hypothetical protein
VVIAVETQERRVHVHAQLFVPGPLPGMNEILAARGSVSGAIEGTHKRANKYGELKKKWTREVQTRAMVARLDPGCIPAAHFTFLHFERDQLRDPDNLCGGAQKILLDALKGAGLMANDGWRHVLGIRHHWICEPADRDGFQAVGVQLYAGTDTLSLALARAMAEPVVRLVAMIPRAREKRASRTNGAPGLFGAGPLDRGRGHHLSRR